MKGKKGTFRAARTRTQRWLRAGRLFLAAFALFLAALVALYPRWDRRVDLDYHFTLSALMNHGTPDILASDLEGATPTESRWMRAVWDSHPDPEYCLSRNADGVLYGQHFWLWPLLCAPAGLLFRAMDVHPLRAHSATLAFFLWTGLWLAWRRMKGNPVRRFAFVLAAGVGPVLFYLWAFGGEGFMYVAALWAVTALSRRRFDLAASAVALASLQNTSLFPFAGLLAFFHFADASLRGRASPLENLFVSALALTPALASPLFYLRTFGRPTLFADIVPPRLSYLSLKLFMMEFFDLNAGLILFLPIPVLLYFAAWGREGLKAARAVRYPDEKRGPALRRILFSPLSASLAGVVLVPFVASTWIAWNTGYLGLIRSAVPLVPFLLLIAVSFRFRTMLAAALTSALLTGAGLATLDGGKGAHLSWGPVARVVLRYAPAFCGIWTDEVMYERTLGYPWGRRELDGGYRRLPTDIPVWPIVYADPEWGPRKILSTAGGWRNFRAAFGFERPELFAFVDRAFDAAERDGKTDALLYFDLPSFKKTGRVALKRLPPDRLRYTVSADLPAFVKAGAGISFDLRVQNRGDLPFMPVPRGLPGDNEWNILCGLARADSEGIDGSLELVLVAVVPLPDPIGPGETAAVPVTLTPPGPGEWLLVALPGQGDTFPRTNPEHRYLRHTLTVE